VYPKTPMIDMVKTGVKKYFRSGGIRGSIYNLCSATLGAGALSIPFAFMKAGYAVAILLLITAGLTTIFSISLLVEAREYTGLQSLEEISVICFGRKFGYFVELNVLLLCFGTAIAYIVAIGDLLTPLLLLTEFGKTISRQYVMIGFWLFVIAPFSMLDKMNSLRFTSLFGVMAIFFLAGVTVYSSILTMATKGFAVTWGTSTAIPVRWFDLLQSIPIIIFAFTCQINVIPIYNELEYANAKRMKKVTRSSVFLSFTVYFLMGVFGYLNFADVGVDPNVLSSYQVEKSHNPLHISAYVAILLTIALAYPLSVFPLRYTLDTVCV
jgi:amino acid permease